MVGIGLAVIVGAYVAQPLLRTRRAAVSAQTIEDWVALVRAERDAAGETAAAPPPVAAEPEAEAEVNFCPHCGRRVAADYRFCPGCGADLRGV